MLDINTIPRGKNNKISRDKLMQKNNISNRSIFEQELKETRQEYIIISDAQKGGYFRPRDDGEYIQFILEYKQKAEYYTKLSIQAGEELKRNIQERLELTQQDTKKENTTTKRSKKKRE